jgi:cellulose synthase/poly-beta-1,6-N-acetylglucosamine synthase-like glycosyltransferase
MLVFSWWAALLLLIYTFAGYPLLLWIYAQVKKPRAIHRERCDAAVSIIVAAHNEERHIVGRLENLKQLLANSGRSADIIVVSDASTDGTLKLARGVSDVRVIELPKRSGKATALNVGCDSALGTIIVFADARQTWADGAVEYLLENFADSTVGGVSGDLVVQKANGAVAGVGIYWRYEKWLRQLESKVHSSAGVTGAISAVRKSLCRPLPSAIVLDDVYWPLVVAQAGYRVIHDPRAVAYDHLPDRIQDEFRRKLRTLSGCFQLASALPSALLPWRNPIWLQFVSHKLLRLVAPWALLMLIVTSFLIPGTLYRWAGIAQVAGYLWGMMGLWRPVSKRLPLSGAIAGFLTLQAAAWLAFWVWVLGLSSRSWTKVQYATTQGAATSHNLGEAIGNEIIGHL